jgi:hypothetical protein
VNRRALARAFGALVLVSAAYPRSGGAAEPGGEDRPQTHPGGEDRPQTHPSDSAPRVTVDRVAVRYYAPETGGSGRPHFVSERMLAFEARLVALAEQAPDTAGYDDRYVRAALDRHIAEDMLAALAVQSGTMPPDLTALAKDERTALVERVGEDALRGAMDAEGIDDAEVDSLLRRRVRAAWYIDRAVLPLLQPSEEQLREVYRTSAHPFKNRPFEEARAPLSRWFVDERLKAAETNFLQVARARVRVVVVPR